jgi:hypothetical protein
LDLDGLLFFFETRNPRARPELDQRTLLATIQQGPVNVGPMGHRVRVAEAPGEALVGGNLDDRLAADAVHHQHALDEHRFALDELADAERVDCVPGVGRELDARADLAELARLLQNDAAETLARQGERRGEAADAAAGDDYRTAVTRSGYTQTCRT